MCVCLCMCVAVKRCAELQKAMWQLFIVLLSDILYFSQLSIKPSFKHTHSHTQVCVFVHVCVIALCFIAPFTVSQCERVRLSLCRMHHLPPITSQTTHRSEYKWPLTASLPPSPPFLHILMEHIWTEEARILYLKTDNLQTV